MYYRQRGLGSMYESPINIYELTRDIQQKINQDQEEKVMECICEYGINVDKEELIKALNYDRNQYQKGFADAIDKIRAEIALNAYPIVHGVNNRELGMTLYGILEVIDKHKAESNEKYKEFAEWVAEEIFSDDWEYNKDSFEELACRKLEKLEIVEKDGAEWVLLESEDK